MKEGAIVSRAGAVLLVLIGASTVVGGEPDHYCYHFKERKPLAIDASRVAVFERVERAAVGEIAAQRDWAVEALQAQAAEAMVVPGWSLVPTVGEVAVAGNVRDVVKRASSATLSAFVSPVFFGDDGGPVIVTPRILVGFNDGVSAAETEAVLASLQSGAILDRDWANMKGAYRLESSSLNGFEVLDAANRLAERPEVKFAEPDMLFSGHGSLIPNDTFFGTLWGLHNTGQSGGLVDADMDAPEAWDVTIGDPSIIVAVLDSGVQQDHPDINQLTPGIDTTSEVGDGGPVNACDNHGTAVAGCISARINNNLGMVGVAPGCRVASARPFISTLDCSGSWNSSASWTVDALAWAETIGAKVSNNSNYYGFSSSAIEQKYSDTRNAGMVHFASAGNDGSIFISYPASLSTVNAVAALNRSGNRTGFSNYGVGLAFSAPGQSIGTTDRTGSDGWVSGDYVNVDGTSFASPYTAGVAALVLSVDAGLNAFTVEQILAGSCVDLGPAGYDTDYGWGFVNARQAVVAASGLECAIAAPPQSDSVRVRNRYMAVSGGEPGLLQALRVTFADLPAPLDVLNGTQMWIDNPHEISELPSVSDNTPPTFAAATLTCDSVFADWSVHGVIQVYHEAIVAGGTYRVQAVNATCDTANELSYSDSFDMTMARWGDLVGGFVAGSWEVPDGSVDVATDVIAVLDAFGGAATAPSKSRADLEPALPDHIINITDAVVILDAFAGAAYPFSAPASPCP